jgi:uncharacterized protein (TIGR03437 family)
MTVPCPDTFLTKLSPTGEILFLTYFGGTGGESGASLAVDGSGNVWIAGNTGSSDLPVTANAALKSLPHAYSGFVAEIDSTGSRILYCSYLSGNPAAMAFARPNNYRISLYLAENHLSDFSVTAGAINVAGGHCDLTALRGDGSLAITARFAGSCSGIAIGEDNSVFIAGGVSTSDPAIPATAGAWQTRPGGGTGDAFAAKLDSSLAQVLWATYIGGSGNDTGGFIQLDPEGNVWVAGNTDSSDFPLVGNAAYSVLAPSANVNGFLGFLVRLAPDGSRALVSQHLPGNPASLSLDASGNVVLLLGLIADQPFAATPGSQWPCIFAKAAPSALTKLSADGTRVLWSSFNGPSLPVGAMALDASGNVVVAGYPADTIEGAEVAKAVSVAGPPRLVQQCVEQSGSPYGSGPIAPGELVSIYGAGFGPSQGVVPSIGPDQVIPSELAGIRVMVEGTPAPLLYVSSNQINLVAPYEIGGGSSARIYILSANGESNEVNLGVAATAPEVFEFPAGGTYYVAVLNQDLTVNGPNNPAHPGDIVALYASGAGQMSPAATDGEITKDASQKIAQQVRVHLDWDGQPGAADAEVTYAGAAPLLVSGVVQINFRIPAGATFYSTFDYYMYVNLTIGDQTVTDALIAVSP